MLNFEDRTIEQTIDLIINASKSLNIDTMDNVLVLGLEAYKLLKEEANSVIATPMSNFTSINGVEIHPTFVIPLMNYMILSREQFEDFKKEEEKYLNQKTIHPKFLESNNQNGNQWLLDIPTFKHIKHDCFLSQYDWNTDEDLRLKDLYLMYTYIRTFSGKVIDRLFISSEMIQDEDFIDLCVQESLDRINNHINEQKP